MPLKVWGIMRLALKYEVAMLRTIIIRHLEREWPCTLAEWEQEQHKQSVDNPRLAGIRTETGTGRVLDYMKLPEPASAIRFALEFDCPSILPAAFYELLQCGVMAQWDDSCDEARGDFLTRPAR